MAKNQAFEDEELEALLKEASTAPKVDFKKAAEQVIETHKDTLKKLAVNDTSVKWEQAFGVNKNEHGKWDVTEVLYNPITNECRINNVIRSESSKAVAQARSQEAMARVLNGLSLNSMIKTKK